MSKEISELKSSLHFEKRIVQKSFTRCLSRYEQTDLEEIRRLDKSFCPACHTPIAYPIVKSSDVYGDKHFDYNIYNCNWCGWWDIVKYCVNPTTDEIYWIQKMQPQSESFSSINEFNYYDDYPEIRFLMRFLAKENEKIPEISWIAFQNLVKEYLLDIGLEVADISRIRSSGGDFLTIDTNGKMILVEVKHQKKSAEIGYLWKLIGVITTEGLDGGLIITSHKLSPDALTLVERGSIGRFTDKEERKLVKSVERESLIRWLLEVQSREHRDMLSSINGAIADDIMMEM